MKILVIFCGGTLVMVENEHGALDVPPKDEAIACVMNLEPRLSEIADLDVHYIDNIDSTNMNPTHWDTIAGHNFDPPARTHVNNFLAIELG